MFYYCQHASLIGYFSACIVIVDSDVPIYAIYYAKKLDIQLFVQIGTKSRRRILDIQAISAEPISNCLPALHAFTGCDYTSAFHGIGKAKAYKIHVKNPKFQEVFTLLGDLFEFDADLFQSIQEFVCILYGLKKTAGANEARYLKFCGNKEKIPEPQELPPTSDELYLHWQRVSYCTAIAKSASECNPVIPSPDSYGWKISNENALDVTWMTQKPAAESILELVSCRCK
eukprot:gene2711-3133_t